MDTKKVRRKKFNFLKLLIFLLFLYLIISFILFFIKKPIKNIVILNNVYLTDEEIIEGSKIEKYPSFFRTTKSSINKKLDKLSLINEVKVKKSWGYILTLDIFEHKILYQLRSNNMYVLDNGEELNINRTINGIPVLINYVPDDITKKLVKEFSKLEINIIAKISEIEYTPTTYDSERFLLYMNDGNEVYITLSKTKEMNKYVNIVKKLEGKKGILYLDSGNYFEIKE